MAESIVEQFRLTSTVGQPGTQWLTDRARNVLTFDDDEGPSKPSILKMRKPPVKPWKPRHKRGGS